MIRLRKRMAEKGRGWQEDDGNDCGYGDMEQETPGSSDSSDGEGRVESSSELKGPLEVTLALEDDDVDGDTDDIGVIDSHALAEGHDQDSGDVASSCGSEVDAGKDENEDPEGPEANCAPRRTVSESSKEAPMPAPPTARDAGPSAAPSTWQSEREALKTILELKVLSVIGDVEDSMEGFADDAAAAKKDTLVRQVAYLKKLVEMTVMAMSDV